MTHSKRDPEPQKMSNEGIWNPIPSSLGKKDLWLSMVVWIHDNAFSLCKITSVTPYKFQFLQYHLCMVFCQNNHYKNLKVNESRYIALFVVSRSAAKLFSMYYFSQSIVFAITVLFFNIISSGLARWNRDSLTANNEYNIF